MTWRYEDGGPARRQTAPGSFSPRGSTLEVSTRTAPAITMVVADERTSALYLLRHTAGDDATAIVERIDPISLEPLATSEPLPAGPVWPGGIGVADDGSLHVVFGRYAHRLDPNLEVVARRELPRAKPYNSFVTLADGHLVTKDFAGSLPSRHVERADREPSELVVLEPGSLEIIDRCVLPEPSIARLSADANTVYAVGDTSLLRVAWDGRRLAIDDGFHARYRNSDDQGYGWDCVLADGHAWFLDNGEGSERYSGTLRGHGVATDPLHLVRVDLGTGDVAMAEVCGRPGGLVANPPVVDVARGIAIAYDSGNGVVAGFDTATLEMRWQRDQDHGSHLVLFEESGEVVMGDHDDVVVLDVTSGEERARIATGSGLQSVLFPMPGFDRDVYVCTFFTVSRIAVTPG